MDQSRVSQGAMYKSGSWGTYLTDVVLTRLTYNEVFGSIAKVGIPLTKFVGFSSLLDGRFVGFRIIEATACNSLRNCGESVFSLGCRFGGNCICRGYGGWGEL